MTTFTNHEKEFLTERLNRSINYLEFGIGESTIISSQSKTIKTINCIETCQGWIDYIKNKIENNDKIIKIDYIDINSNCNNYARPYDKSKKQNWPIYQEYSHNKEYDLCLIDGRFRVASFLNTYLNAKTNCCLLIHDYQRKNYKDIEKVIPINGMVDTFGIFYKNQQNNNSSILEMIEKYQNDFE